LDPGGEPEDAQIEDVSDPELIAFVILNNLFSGGTAAMRLKSLSPRCEI
jgi:hypothetical protein